MADFESRDNVVVPRWGHDTAGAIDPGVTEPPGVKKDTGWVSGVDVPNGSWWNWLHQAASYFFLYLETAIGRILPRNHLARSGFGTTDGEVTAGVGLTVDVASSFDWIEGQMFEVPAAVNLALAAADPTNPRIDVVVSDVTAGVPSFAVVTGTPAGSPTVPAIGSNQVSHAEVAVAALAVIPGLITDTRRFGALGAGVARFDWQLQAGEIGPDLMFEVDAVDGLIHIGTSGQLIEINDFLDTVDIGPTILSVDAAANRMQVAPEKFEYYGVIVRKVDLSVVSFQTAGGPTVTIGSNIIRMTPGDIAVADVRIPNGGVITAITIYGENQAGGQLDVILTARLKGNNINSIIVSGDTFSQGTGVFAMTLGSGGALPFTVDQSQILQVQLAGNLITVDFWAVDITWEELKPFDGI